MKRERGTPRYKTKKIIQDEMIHHQYYLGKSYMELRSFFMSEYGMTETIFQKNYKQARDNFKVETALHSNYFEQLDEDIQQLYNLYSMSIKKGSLGVGREILKDIHELKGHYVDKQQLMIQTEWVADFGQENNLLGKPTTKGIDSAQTFIQQWSQVGEEIKNNEDENC